MPILFFSIVLEALVALLFFIIAARGPAHRHYYALALTFGIYVWYDLARYLSWNVSQATADTVFFIATVSALYAAWRIYKK